MKDAMVASRSELHANLQNLIQHEREIQSFSLVRGGEVILRMPGILQTQFSDDNEQHFVLADELHGIWYEVTSRGPHCELMIPLEDGYIRVTVGLEVDLVDLADRVASSFGRVFKHAMTEPTCECPRTQTPLPAATMRTS